MKISNAPTLSLLLLFTGSVLAQETEKIHPLEKTVSSRGTISFVMRTDRTYQNGTWEHQFRQPLVELPGFSLIGLDRQYDAISIGMNFLNAESHSGFFLTCETLPGPESYHLLFTWDADEGLADAYINGTLFRTEDPKYYAPWEMKGRAEHVRIPPGPVHVSQLSIRDTYVRPEDVLPEVPEFLRGKRADLVRPGPLSPPPIGTRKGRRIYSARLNREADIRDWVLEGPGDLRFENGSMVMKSILPEEPPGAKGHFNLWCPVDLPDRCILEWEYQPLSERAISLFFFAAKGWNGEDIFDPSLPARNGLFPTYIDGAIRNYWIVYHTNHQRMRTSNIATTYLYKSGKAALLSKGRSGIPPGSGRFHHLCLIKDGPRIQFQIDGTAVLDFTDPDSERYGRALTDGKFSFRQMEFTTSAYRNFSIWVLDE